MSRPLADGPDPMMDDAPDQEPVRIENVDSGLVRETLLGAIGLMQHRVVNGKFNGLDAQTLERLFTLVKDFPALAKAVDDLQANSNPADSTGDSTPSAATAETITKLRVLLGKGGR